MMDARGAGTGNREPGTGNPEGRGGQEAKTTREVETR